MALDCGQITEATLNKPALFWTFFFRWTEYLYTGNRPHKSAPEDHTFMPAAVSGREKKSLLIGVTAFVLSAAGAELTQFSGMQAFS